MALYEYMASMYIGESLDPVEKIYTNVLMKSENIENMSNTERTIAFLTYCEILIGRNSLDKALQILIAFILNTNITFESVSGTKKLHALQIITKHVDSIVAVEKNVEIMTLEQYILPDRTTLLIKARALLLYLLNQKIDSLNFLDKLLKIFIQSNDRHRFIREYLWQCYILISKLPSPHTSISQGFIYEKICQALEEFPRNFFLLQRLSMMTLSWYKVKSTLLRQPSIYSIIFLIVTARYRYVLCTKDTSQSINELENIDIEHMKLATRNRILSTFRTISNLKYQSELNRKEVKSLHRNPLFWRFYLRFLSDKTVPFETSKTCLLSGLDECPWSKALYVDGSTYVPQEFSNMQDLILEKQLRIYALPEELEILRNNFK